MGEVLKSPDGLAVAMKTKLREGFWYDCCPSAVLMFFWIH